MRTKTLLLLAILVPCLLSAQQPMTSLGSYGNPPKFFSDHGDNMISYDLNMYRASNAVNSKIMGVLAFGGSITQEDKDAVTKKLKAENTYGFDLDNGLLYSRRMGEMVFFGGLSNRIHSSGTFTDDAFELIFNGNSGLAGETADLTGTHIQVLFYNQVKLGTAFTTDAGNGEMTYYVAVNVNLGGVGYDMKLGNSTLFTEETGDYIDITLNSDEILVSDTGAFKTIGGGIGGGLDLGFSYETDASIIAFAIRDLGIISWSSGKELALNSSYHYDGVEISQFFSSVDTAIQKTSADSLLEVLDGTWTDQKFSSTTPIVVDLSYTQKFNNEYSAVTVGLHNTFTSSLKYFPHIYAKGHHYVEMADLDLAATLAYGGYGSWHLGAELGKKFGDSFMLRLGSNSLLGWILTRNMQGSSIFASAAIAF